MSDPQHDIRTWLAYELSERGHGAKGALAKFLKVRPDAITRMANTDPEKETREIKAHEIDQIRLFFSLGETKKPLAESFDPDAPDYSGLDDRTDETPYPEGSGDVANLEIRAGLGIGSPEGVPSEPETTLGARTAIYADHVNGFWSFPDAVKAGWRNMPQVYSIPVEGDSMEPTLTSGSYVFVDMTHIVPQPEDIYACDYGDGLTIKRLQLVPRTDKIKVMADNPRYSDYELRREDVRVYGRVVAWFQWRG